jgi:hypothetical protein
MANAKPTFAGVDKNSPAKTAETNTIMATAKVGVQS